MLKLLPVFILLVWRTPALNAQDPCTQLNYHAFKAESLQGTYTDLENVGTEIITSQWDDAVSGPLDIGFAFEFQCQSYTQFIFSTNGFIKLGSDPLSATNIFFSNNQSNENGLFERDDSTLVNLIVAFNHDLDAGSDTPEYRVHTGGTAPQRVCTIQWKNIREWTNEPEKRQLENFDFQIRLYETTNVIEFVYGELEGTTNTSNYRSAACGLRGKSAADDQLLVVIKNSSAFWDNVSFVNRKYASNESFNFGRPPERPAPDPGRTFRFTPTLFNDLTVRETYVLTEASTHYSSPQLISASIRNSGYHTQTNIPVTLEITGDNPYTKTQHIPSLAFGEGDIIHFYTYRPKLKGTSTVRVRVGPDDANADNAKDKIQQAGDYKLNYSTTEAPDAHKGFLAGVQGIYYVKYNVRGTAEVSHVDVYIADDSASIGKTVFAAVLDSNGALVARSDNYVIQETNRNSWLSFGFNVSVVITDSDFYAGFGMTSSLQDYAPLGVQREDPVHPDTYYKSLVTGSGLTEVDPVEVPYRFMIGVTLESTQPEVGPVHTDTTVCAGDFVTISLEYYVGFFHWQTSPDGVNNWFSVTDVNGEAFGQSAAFAADNSAYFRVKVTQPGFEPVYSDTIYIEVLAERPYITASGDILSSSATEGNQWYDGSGPIDGATSETYFATEPGTYYTIVTQEGCVSPPSNAIELITVSSDENEVLKGVKIYPNPVKDELQLEMEDNKLVNVEIMTMTGDKIYRGAFNERSIIHTGTWIPGMYCIKMTMNREVFIKSFIKL